MIDPMTGAIVASGVAALLIGMIWYHPMVFGGVWARILGMTPEMMAKGKRRMPITALIGLLAAMFIAYVMSYVSAAWGFYDWYGGFQLGFWCWAGFVAPVLLGSVLWELKPFRFFLINASYWLVTFLVMAQLIVFAYSLEYSIYLAGGADQAAYESE